MNLAIQNLTTELLAVTFGPTGSTVLVVLPPSRQACICLRKKHSGWITISEDTGSECEKASTAGTVAYSVRTTKQSTSWCALKLPQHCPWRVYHVCVTRGHGRILIFPRRSLSTYLSEMPDAVPLSSLTLPGTHDSMSFYGWPISQCQQISTPLAVQLQSGIRVLDIRLAVIDSRLISYHGVYPQKTPFQDILSTIHSFLTAHPTCRETIIMSIKQEDFTSTPLPLFSKLVHDEIYAAPGGRDMWFLDNRIPKLGEVRGKVIMVSRFGGNGAEWERGLEGLGIHPTAWPDNEKIGFQWMCKGTLVRTHDWYDINTFLSIPEKTSLSTRILAAPPDPLVPTLSITYFSASSFPLAFPSTVARGFGWPKWGLGIEGVNSRVGRWLLDILGGHSDLTINCAETKLDLDELCIRGWAFADFYDDPDGGIVPLLVECNFRGRREGEEGWHY